MTAETLTLADKCETAAKAYERVLDMPEGKPVSVASMGLAAALVLTMHGHLFAEAAAALRARGEQS